MAWLAVVKLDYDYGVLQVKEERHRRRETWRLAPGPYTHAPRRFSDRVLLDALASPVGAQAHVSGGSGGCRRVSFGDFAASGGGVGGSGGGETLREPLLGGRGDGDVEALTVSEHAGDDMPWSKLFHRIWQGRSIISFFSRSSSPERDTER